MNDTTDTLRPISARGFDKPSAPAEPGPAPVLQWIPIADLVVDDVYQRPIRMQGRKNVQTIASGFRWAFFAPVVVSPIEGGKFAIVDGQHRTTGALLAGFSSVPCSVVIAPQKVQAAAFKAINGSVTKISRMAMHAASLAAGDENALALEYACRAAGVTLLRFPVAKPEQKPGQTMAVQATQQCFARYGRDTLITALQCVTETSNNAPGILSGEMIRGLCSVLDANRTWRDSGGALLDAMDEIDLGELERQARKESVTTRGKAPAIILADLIAGKLRAALPMKAA